MIFNRYNTDKFFKIKHISTFFDFFNQYRVQNILFCAFLFVSIYVIKYNIFIFPICFLYPVFFYFYICQNISIGLFYTYILFFVLSFFSCMSLYYVENVVDKKIYFLEIYKYLSKIITFYIYVSGLHALFKSVSKDLNREEKIDFWKMFGLFYILCFFSSVCLDLCVLFVEGGVNVFGYNIKQYENYLFLFFSGVLLSFLFFLFVKGCVGLYRYIIKESKFKNNNYIKLLLDVFLFLIMFVFMMFIHFVRMDDALKCGYFYFLLYFCLSLIYAYFMIKSFSKSECLFLNFAISVSWVIAAFIDFSRVKMCFFYMDATQFLFFIYPFIIFLFVPEKKFSAELNEKSIITLFLIFAIMFGVETFLGKRL